MWPSSCYLKVIFFLENLDFVSILLVMILLVWSISEFTLGYRRPWAILFVIPPIACPFRFMVSHSQTGRVAVTSAVTKEDSS